MIFGVHLVFIFIFLTSGIIKKNAEPTLGRTRPGHRLAGAFIRCHPGAREPSRRTPTTLPEPRPEPRRRLAGAAAAVRFLKKHLGLFFFETPDFF